MILYHAAKSLEERARINRSIRSGSEDEEALLERKLHIERQLIEQAEGKIHDEEYFTDYVSIT